MTTREQNDFLTQTGPGTPMGDLFRRYWIPALMSKELPEPDCPPVRVKLLSERLLAFRDTQGRIGLMDEFCAHRGVSLWFGRNEENGLRCPYHGWKYDVTGQCIDVPSEPEESGYCKKIKLKSYPCVELGDVIWTYMGPPELKPPLPGFRMGAGAASASLRVEAHAGMQLSAGDGRRHRFRARVVPAPARPASSDSLHVSRGAELTARPTSRFEVIETDGGMVIGVRRPARARPALLADHAMDHAVPQHDPALRRQRAQRPRLGADDDENCMSWCFTHHPTRPLTEHELTTYAQRRRHPRQPDPRHVPSGRSTRTTTT